MQNKIKKLLLIVGVFAFMAGAVRAEDVVDDIAPDSIDEVEVEVNEQISADAISDYNVEGSLFQQITDLEQEKVLMQLEKERAQLNLDLDRLAAEKIKLHMEIDTLSGRAEQQQQEFETERARLEAEAKRLEMEKVAMENKQETAQQKTFLKTEEESVPDVQGKYKLINVFGSGAQLQATIQDVSSGQNKRISVGKDLDGYTVKSISLDEGVVFDNGAERWTLNVKN